MKALHKKLENMPNKNKGFTMIEILVVAGMLVILTAFLAPQYIQYLERGNRSNDVEVARILADAVLVVAADPANENIASRVPLTVTWRTTSDGEIVIEEQGGGTTPYVASVQSEVDEIMRTKASGDIILAKSTAARNEETASPAGVGNFVLEVDEKGDVILISTGWRTELGMNIK